MNATTSKRHLDKSVPYGVQPGRHMAPERGVFLSAHLSAIAHATEDVARVEQAVRFLIEAMSLGEVRLTRQYLKGHYGNVITILSARVPGKGISREAIKLLSQKLPEFDRQFLLSDVSRCVDEEGNLYLRFDKQEACLRIVKLYQGDPIRVKLKFTSAYDAEGIVKFCKENGLIP